MDIDETKKRKIEEEAAMDVDSVLKEYIENNAKVAKLMMVLAQKVLNLERIFSKDLFTPQK